MVEINQEALTNLINNPNIVKTLAGGICIVVLALVIYVVVSRFKKWHNKNKHKKNFNPNDMPFRRN